MLYTTSDGSALFVVLHLRFVFDVWRYVNLVGWLCVVCRGLFEKDKLVFSFMLCVEILKLSDQVLPEDWNYFTRGATGAEVDVPAKPDVPWLQQWQWNDACKLDAVLPAFKGLKGDIVATPCWVKFGENNVVSFM